MPGQAPATRRIIDIVNASLKRRYAQERRFRFLGAAAVTLGLLFVAVLFLDIVAKGYTAFQQTYIQVPIDFDADDPGPRRRAGSPDPGQRRLHGPGQGVPDASSSRRSRIGGSCVRSMPWSASAPASSCSAWS